MMIRFIWGARYISIYKVPLRCYLRAIKQPHRPDSEELTRGNSRLAEVEEIVNNQLINLRQDRLEHKISIL